MGKLHLAVLVLVAALEAVGLVALEVGHGGNLQPAALSGAPELEVVGDGAGEAQVSAAEAKDAVLKTQFIHEAFHVGHHFVQSSVAVLGLLYAHNFHFVKLVQAVKAAHVFAVGTGLTAEAGRVGGKLLGELVGAEDDVTEDVGDGNLGGRDHIEVVQVGVVHLAFLVGQLAGTKTGSGVHHHRRLHFLVAGCGVAVQEVVDEGALQLGAFAFIYRETGTGNLHAQVEVDDVVLLGQFPVGKCVLGEVHLGAAHLHHQVVLGTLTLGYQVAGDVGQEHQLVLELLDGLVGLLEKGGGTLLDGGDFCLGGFGLGLLAFLHELADGGGSLLLLAQESVALGLESLAFVVQGDDVFYDGAGVKVLDSQFLDNKLRVFAEEFQCKHIP